MSNITTATFNGESRRALTCPLYQYDYGQVLQISGLELPASYQVHFANNENQGEASIVIGTADGASIPNELLQTGKDVWAFIFLNTTADDGETEYVIHIPVIKRPVPEEYEPTPEEQSIVTQLLGAVGELGTEVGELRDDLTDLDNRVTALEEGSGSGLTDDIKTALLDVVANIAFWKDDDGQAYYDALYDALYPPANLVSISAAYTQSGTVYDTDTLDSLKSDLVVTANYDNGTTQTVTDYVLSGTLAVGTSTITVSYGGKTTTFSVTVSEGEIDTTAEIIDGGEDKILIHLSSSPYYKTEDNTNGAVTIKYEMDEPSTVLWPAGIIATDSTSVFYKGASAACFYVCDANGEPINFVNELTGNTYSRWAQNVNGTMTEYSSSYYTVEEYSYIQFTVDKRYLDDSYMYDMTTGQVFFAGENTPYYGKENVRNEGDPLYPFKDGSYSGSSVNASLTNSNHFDIVTSANTREFYTYKNGLMGANTVTSSVPTLFSLKAGDKVEIKVKNIRYNGSAAADNYFYCSIAQQGGTSALYSAGKIEFGEGDGTVADKSLVNTVSADVNVSGIKTTIYRATGLEFDYEVWVNDVLYIGPLAA